MELVNTTPFYDFDKTYFETLKCMVTKIDTMQKSHHIGILRILMQTDEDYINENKNGIYVNLSEVNKTTIISIQKYLDYIEFQEKNLNKIEAKQEDVKITFSQNYI
jgi:hypothetical protein